jgi:hypothetical protein
MLGSWRQRSVGSSSDSLVRVGPILAESACVFGSTAIVISGSINWRRDADAFSFVHSVSPVSVTPSLATTPMSPDRRAAWESAPCPA